MNTSSPYLAETVLIDSDQNDCLQTREQTFRAFRQSEAKYRNFIEKLPVMFYAAQPEPPYAPIYISPEFESFGYPLEQWLSKTDMWMSILHPDDRNWVLQETDAAMSAGRETDYEYRIVAQDGSFRWVHDRGRFVADENGRMICWQGIMLDVTDQKQAEANLRVSEKRYRQMFEKNRAIKLLIDAESGAIVDANPAACDFYGYALDEFKTKKITDINTLPPEQVAEEMKRAASEKHNYFTFRHRLASGEVRDVEVHSSPFSGQNGRLLYSIIYDITERVRAERALKESEARYRQLIEQASDIIYRTDANGNFVFVNSAAARLFNCKEDKIAGLHYLDLVHPAHRQAANHFYQKQFVERIAETYYEFTAITRDGAEICIGQNVRLLLENNQVLGFQAVARDITERVRAEDALKESEARYRSIFENANDIIYTHDLAGNYTSINKAAERVFGYTREEALKMNMTQIVAPESLETARRNLEAKIAGAKQAVYEINCITKTGSPITIEINSRAIYKNKIPVAVQGIARDITERKQAEQALKESEGRYRDLFENANDLIYTHDLAGNFTSLNRAGETITGYTREEVMNLNIAQIVAPEYLDMARGMISRKIEGGAQTVYELEIIAKDGHRVTLELSTRLIYQEKKPVGVQGIARDITARRCAEKELIHNASHDTLTNLPNRAAFMNYLKLANARQSRSESGLQFAVLFLDLDRFKVINDGLGHIVGDKLLVAIAERLQACVRPGDLVARFGGDEFTILLGDIKQTEDATHIAERVQRELSLPFKLDNYEVFTSASIGIIVSDEVHRQPEDFLRDADTAMYRAKESGKARYEIFDREMHVRNMTLLQIENDLRRAVEREEFRVFYQPIVGLRTVQIQEFEALVRWQHPQHGLIAPDQFINVAEETGLIVPIGKWVLHEACRQTREWQRDYALNSEQLCVSVNLSAKQLMHPALIGQINEILAQTELGAEFLKLEVTESMVIEHSDTALDVLSQLRALGIGLSTDDFGTGYSSLSYLHRFPFGRLKIDRSFVNKMDSDSKSSEIVRTILMLAKTLNMEVVAEGIETERQLNLLRRLGCKFGQGFLYSKPVSAVAAKRLLCEGVANFESKLQSKTALANIEIQTA